MSEFMGFRGSDRIAKVLVTGASGQLGTAIQKIYPDPTMLGFVWLPITRNDIDLSSSSDEIHKYLRAVNPDIIVNAAAYTDVDGAESHVDECYAINYLLPKVLQEYCIEDNKHLIHISTDYVFGTPKEKPFTERDPLSPLNVYGASKRKGEEFLLANGRAHILRTSWLYGPRAWGKSFYKSIFEKGLRGEALKVVTDEVGSPTSTISLARAIVKFLHAETHSYRLPKGVYHCADKGTVSRYEFAKAILALDPRTSNVEITPILQADLPPRPAVRPKYSPLSCRKLSGYDPTLIRPWKEGLKAVYMLDKKESRNEI